MSHQSSASRGFKPVQGRNQTPDSALRTERPSSIAGSDGVREEEEVFFSATSRRSVAFISANSCIAHCESRMPIPSPHSSQSTSPRDFVRFSASRADPRVHPASLAVPRLSSVASVRVVINAVSRIPAPRGLRDGDEPSPLARPRISSRDFSVPT